MAVPIFSPRSATAPPLNGSIAGPIGPGAVLCCMAPLAQARAISRVCGAPRAAPATSQPATWPPNCRWLMARCRPPWSSTTPRRHPNARYCIFAIPARRRARRSSSSVATHRRLGRLTCPISPPAFVRWRQSASICLTTRSWRPCSSSILPIANCGSPPRSSAILFPGWSAPLRWPRRSRRGSTNWHSPAAAALASRWRARRSLNSARRPHENEIIRAERAKPRRPARRRGREPRPRARCSAVRRPIHRRAEIGADLQRRLYRTAVRRAVPADDRRRRGPLSLPAALRHNAPGHDQTGRPVPRHRSGTKGRRADGWAHPRRQRHGVDRLVQLRLYVSDAALDRAPLLLRVDGLDLRRRERLGAVHDLLGIERVDFGFR